jgi:hypothetical protein
MRLPAISVRRGWLSCIGLAVIAVVGLLVAGSHGLALRTFVLDAKNQYPLVLLYPSTRVCEGPVTSQGPARSVGIWGASAFGPARLTVEVQDAVTRRLWASGDLEASTVENEYTARLARLVPGDRPLRICLTEDLNTFSLEGSAAVHPNVVMTGKATGQEFSLVLLSDNRSLLSSLPTAFSRASLFRPSWVGSWTLWVLAIALLATFGLGVAAVASAVSASDEEDRPPGDQSREGDSPPSPDGRTGDSSRSAARR